MDSNTVNEILNKALLGNQRLDTVELLDIIAYIKKLEQEIKPLDTIRHFAINQIKSGIYEDWRGNYVLISELKKLLYNNELNNEVVDNVTEKETDKQINNGYKKVGYVLQNSASDYCIVSPNAVRYLTNGEAWSLMHTFDFFVNKKEIKKEVTFTNKNFVKKNSIQQSEMWDRWNTNYIATILKLIDVKLPDLNLNTELSDKCFDDSICGSNGVYCILCVSKEALLKRNSKNE